MARELDQAELIERWTLIGDNLERVASKRSEILELSTPADVENMALAPSQRHQRPGRAARRKKQEEGEPP
jgi:hypothetical protein